MAGLWTIALKLALVPLAMDPLGEDAFGVIKSAVSRALLYLLLPLVVMYVSTDADARRRLLAPRTIVVAVVAFAGISGMATLFAIHQPTALFGAHHRYLGLTSIVDGVVLALACPVLVISRRDLRVVVLGLLGAAVVVVVYGMIQLARFDPVSWLEPAIFATFGNRGVLAGYLVVVAGVASLLAMRAGRRSPKAIGLAALAGLSVVGVLVSGARGPTLTVPIALAFSGAIAARSGVPLIPRLRIGRALALAVVLAGSAVVVLAAPRVMAFFSTRETSLIEREIVYRSALDMIAARPLLGGGPDHFAVLYPTVRSVQAADVTTVLALGQTSAHSWPLHQAVGTGLVGLFALTLLVVACLRGAWSRARQLGTEASTLGAVVLVSFLLQGTFNIPNVGTEFLFWTGVGLTAVGPLVEEVPTTFLQSVRLPAAIPVSIALGIGVLLSTSTANVVMANRETRASDGLRTAGRFDAAQLAALAATGHDPGRANNWNVLGLARSPKDASRALSAFQRAWEAAPYESRYLINMVKEEARLAENDRKYLDPMLGHARQAVGIDPRNAETHTVLSYARLKTGDHAGARAEAERAIALAPNNPGHYSWSAAIHEDTGDFATAARRLREYLAMVAGSDLTKDDRARLARLYARAGDIEQARRVGQPRIVGISRECEPTCDVLYVYFDAVLGLAEEGSGSARDPSRYSIDGRTLPTGTSISIVHGRTVVLRPAPGAVIAARGATLAVRGVRDTFGLNIEPDPTLLTVP